MTGLLVARFFEAMIPWYVKMGIDNISVAREEALADPSLALDLTDVLTYPAIAIAICVVCQMLVTIVSRHR